MADESATPSETPQPRRWRRRLGCALAALLLLPVGLVLLASFALRHRPYEVPAELRAPAPPDPDEADGGLFVRWLGITGYEITDGETVVLTDPTLTRPGVLELVSGPLEPDAEAARAACPRADYILVNHAHYDHAIDVPAIALATGAVVVGSESACNLARSRGVPEEQVRVVAGGERLELGTFAVEVRRSRHTAILGVEEPMSGTIPPDAGPLWFHEYVQDATLAFRLEAGGSSLWFHPTSTYAEGEMAGAPADNLILGVTGEPLTEAKVAAVLADVGPGRVLPTHYDNFFHGRDAGLALMPRVDLRRDRDLVAAAAPDARFWVLGFDQTVHLPPDDD